MTIADEHISHPYDTLATRVRATATLINNSHGYGNVAACRVFLSGQVELVITRPHMTDTLRRAQYRGGRLYYANTSRKVA